MKWFMKGMLLLCSLQSMAAAVLTAVFAFLGILGKLSRSPENPFSLWGSISMKHLIPLALLAATFSPLSLWYYQQSHSIRVQKK